MLYILSTPCLLRVWALNSPQSEKNSKKLKIFTYRTRLSNQLEVDITLAYNVGSATSFEGIDKFGEKTCDVAGISAYRYHGMMLSCMAWQESLTDKAASTAWCKNGLMLLMNR